MQTDSVSLARPAFVSCRHAAEWIGVSQTTIKRLCDTGQLEHFRTAGGHRRIKRDAMIRWVGRNSATDSTSIEEALAESMEPNEIAEMLMKNQHDRIADWFMARLAAGASMPELFDSSLAPAMHRVGELWENGVIDVHQEHVCSANLGEVLAGLRARNRGRHGDRSATERTERAAPRAIGCAVGDEQHDISSRMAELVLVESGWQAQSLGSSLPLRSLLYAVKEENPTIVWVTYTVIRDPERVVQENRELYHRLAPHQKLVIGGQGLDVSIRRRMNFSFTGDSMSHLVNFAKSVSSQA